MKKLLTAIATTAAVALAGTLAAPAARALPTFGEALADNVTEDDYYDDLFMLLDGNVELSDGAEEALELVTGAISNTMGIALTDYYDLLFDPSLLDSLYAGSDVQNDINKEGFGVFTVQGCSVNADCALKAIGLSLSIQCAGQVGVGNLYSPQAWAECVQDKDIDAYYAALACTWGSCPFSATPAGQKVFACNNSPNAVVAGKVLLNLPPTLSQGKNDSMQIGLLSQG